MQVFISSMCEKTALIKTRRILDTFLLRTGKTSWAGPMTLEGVQTLKTLLLASKTKTNGSAI